MNWNIRNIILVVEFGLLVIPISLLFVMGLYGLITTAFIFPSIANIIVTIVGLITSSTIVAMWMLIYKTIIGKNTQIIKEPYLWSLTLIGVLIAISALTSSYLPSSLYYSVVWDIRQDFELFVIGLPLIIVALHLYYESKKC